MTLIIGCITGEFAVLAGDTQLTVGDLQRGANLKREVEIKVKKYSHRFMMGILGKWSWFYAPKDGVATYINVYDSLNISIQRIDNEVEHLKNFLPKHSEIDATAIFINNEGDDFTMNSVSSQPDRDLSRILIGTKDLIFNEPFYNYRQKMVEENLITFSESNNLDDSLGDVLFLLNNAILDIISSGKKIDLRKDDGIVTIGVDNTVGGYVTIQIMLKNSAGFDCLYRCYDYDYNTLLDKTTFAFSSFVDRHPEIRYLDNLAMLVRGSQLGDNDPLIRKELLKCIEKQLKYLGDSAIVKKYLLNHFIGLVNEKYKFTLDLIAVEREEKGTFTLELILDEQYENIDLDYIKRFI